MSVALMLHDVFAFSPNAFVAGLLSEDGAEACFEMLIRMVCRVAVNCETQEMAFPLLMVVVGTINKTSNQKLDRFVKGGIAHLI